MSDSKEFYKFLITTLIKAKSDNDADFDIKLDKLVTKIDQDLSYAQRLQIIEQDIHSVNKHIHFLDKKITNDAEQYYAGITRKPLRKRLIESYEHMGLFIKNQNTKSACKYLIVQAELLCNHLAHEADIVNWVAKNTPIGITLSGGTSGQYLSTWNLLKAVDRRFSIQFNETIFYEIKQLRDYESHGYHENAIAAMEALLIKVTSNWPNYMTEGLRFIDHLITEQYNYQ
jgi:hypothetical protein